jgi:hypothetical protein
MVKKRQVHAADLRGVNQLTIAGIAGVVDLVERCITIAVIPRMIAAPKRDRTTGITRLSPTGVSTAWSGSSGMASTPCWRALRRCSASAARLAGAQGAARRAQWRAGRLP